LLIIRFAAQAPCLHARLSSNVRRLSANTIELLFRAFLKRSKSQAVAEFAFATHGSKSAVFFEQSMGSEHKSKTAAFKGKYSRASHGRRFGRRLNKLAGRFAAQYAVRQRSLPQRSKAMLLLPPSEARLLSLRPVHVQAPRQATSAFRLMRTLAPNPSLEPTRSGMAPGPRGARVYHPPRGPGATPARAAQLKR